METFVFAAEEAKRIHGETIPMDASPSGEGRIGFYLRMPMGVIAAITPFNFPLNLVAHKVAPALAAGNTLVLKPAEETPLTAVALAEILAEAGLPDGALRVVHGEGPTTGEALVRHPVPAKISFTGSPPVGRLITSLAGLKRVTLELGNNSGTIVEPDADLARAIPRCVMSSFANAGQVCISLQRLYVHEAIAEPFLREFVRQTEALKVGNPLDRDCDVGPLISDEAADRAERWIREAEAEGARIVTGGRREGRLIWPTVLTDTRPEMKVMCQEAFAPLVSIVTYRDFDEALRPRGRFAVRPAGGRLHPRSAQGVRGRPPARRGRRDGERHVDLPRGPHALRRQPHERHRARRRAVRDRGDDEHPDGGDRFRERRRNRPRARLSLTILRGISAGIRPR